MPKAKFGSPSDSDEETNDDTLAAIPNAADPEDGDPEVPSSSTQSLADQIHAHSTWFDAYWDESHEHRVFQIQDMDANRAEMATFRAG